MSAAGTVSKPLSRYQIETVRPSTGIPGAACFVPVNAVCSASTSLPTSPSEILAEDECRTHGRSTGDAP